MAYHSFQTMKRSLTIGIKLKSRNKAKKKCCLAFNSRIPNLFSDFFSSFKVLLFTAGSFVSGLAVSLLTLPLR